MSEMNDIIKNGQLMPADLTAQIRDKYYHVDVDPFTKSKRLFFDNSGGSFRLKDASEAFRNVDDLPNCGRPRRCRFRLSGQPAHPGLQGHLHDVQRRGRLHRHLDDRFHHRL